MSELVVGRLHRLLPQRNIHYVPVQEQVLLKIILPHYA